MMPFRKSKIKYNQKIVLRTSVSFDANIVSLDIILQYHTSLIQCC